MKKSIIAALLISLSGLLSGTEYYGYFGQKHSVDISPNHFVVDSSVLNKKIGGIKILKTNGKNSMIEFDTKFKSKDAVKKFSAEGIALWPVIKLPDGELLETTGKIMISFYEETPEAIKSQVLSQFGFVEISQVLPHVYFALPKTGTDIFALSNKIRKIHSVRWSHPDILFKYELSGTMNDPLYQNQWHLNQMEIENAWDITTGNDLTKIAIFDFQIEETHPDLAPNMEAGFNYFTGKPGTWNKEYDSKLQSGDFYASHGTCVAGLAAAKGNNGIGISGTCPDCSIIPVSIVGGDTKFLNENILKAFQFAVAAGASVINNSWNFNPLAMDKACHPEQLPELTNAALDEAIEWAKNHGRNGKGTVVVWSGGNFGSYGVCGDTKLHKYFNHDNVVVISALRQDGTKAAYSNWGREVDVAVWGGEKVDQSEGLSEAKPLSDGAGLITTDLTSVDKWSKAGLGFNSAMPGYKYGNLADLNYTKGFSGTSAAAPVAAGAIALMLAANPELDYAQTVYCVKKAAEKVETACAEDSAGWIMQEDVFIENGSKLHSNCFGYGVINVTDMVTYAKNNECGEGVADYPTGDDDVVSPTDDNPDQTDDNPNQTDDNPNPTDNNLLNDDGQIVNDDSQTQSDKDSLLNVDDNDDHTHGINSDSDVIVDETTGCGCSVI